MTRILKSEWYYENSGNLRFPEPFPLIRHEGVVRETVGFVSSPNDENIILSNLVKELVQSNQDLAKQTQELHKHIIELSENIRFPLRWWKSWTVR